MFKYIKNVLIILILFLSIGNTTFAAVYYANLTPAQTYYYDPYKIVNNTSLSIFAPFSDSSGKITNNFAGGSSFSFGSQLDKAYTYGGFTISNAVYSWVTGGFGSCSASPYWGSFGACSVSCGGGTQYRTCYGTSGTSYRIVYCMRSDGASVTDGYCSGTKPTTSTSCSSSCSGSNSQSCNTQSCIPTCPSGYSWNYSYNACIKATKIALNCYDGSTAAGWYKTYIGRCGEQDGLNWRNTSISTNGYYIAFNQFNKDKYVTCMNYAGTTNLTLCNNIMLCDYGATYIVNTNYCKK